MQSELNCEKCMYEYVSSSLRVYLLFWIIITTKSRDEVNEKMFV